MASYHYNGGTEGSRVYEDNGMQVVPEAPVSDKIAMGPAHAAFRPDVEWTPYGTSPQNAKAESRILGMRRATFILSCILVLVVIVLVLMAGLFGSKISSLEASRSAAATATVATGGAADPATSPTTAVSAAAAGPSTKPTATSPAGPATTTQAVAGWTYVGCYTDTSARVLNGDSTISGTMTNQFCASYCSQKGFTYFGTEFGDQCYCGNKPQLTAAAPWNCDAHCGGSVNGPEICGGYFYQSVWTTNKSS